MNNNPNSQETPIWRYMNFAEFFRMLEKKQLFFNALRNMDDPDEGWFKGIDMKDIGIDNGVNDILMNGHEARNVYFISSWSKGNEDDLVLWHRFTSLNGVAVKTEFNKMKKILRVSNPSIVVDAVVYSDDLTYKNATGNFVKDVVYKKRTRFSFEKEVRAFVGNQAEGNKGTGGLSVNVNLHDLLEEVRVHPMSGEWFLETVQTAVKMLGFNLPVKRGACGLGR